MDKLMPYLDTLTMIKVRTITRTSQYSQNDSLSSPEERPPIFLKCPHHKMKMSYTHGLTHTISKSSKENGGGDNKRQKVITEGTETQRNIIKNHHDLLAYRHPGIS
jgi:hypothetical protein